jgi:cytidylate kinase
MARVVTMSATYGAGGSVIGPLVAERLGIPFIDRLIVATEEPPTREVLQERLSKEEEEQARAGGLLADLAQATSGLGVPVPGSIDLNPRRTIRQQAETSIAAVVQKGGGVILGRAAAVVLAGHPDAFHIRLDGPPARRIQRAMEIEGLDEATAKSRQSETDRSRARYVKRLYSRDANDPSLYHVILDTTAVPPEVAVDVLVQAAAAFFSLSRPAG